MHGTLYPRPYTVHYLTEAIKTLGNTSSLDDVNNNKEERFPEQQTGIGPQE